ncbi:MAG: ATP-binding protein [Oscillospiraceae bacterium]|nr:ATP-binding protein [Oscillospiraceae bacterium]
MKDTIIIVSGMAAAGKTTFAEWLSHKVCVPLLSVDDLWGKFGTTTIPFAQYWVLCEDIMKQSSPLIIEFGFWDEQKPMINELVKKYKYQTVNIHFVTSIELAHQRFNDRRKLGGTEPQITLERYIEIVEYSKFFQFGDCVIGVDTTDFSRVSYENIAKQIQQLAMGIK